MRSRTFIATLLSLAHAYERSSQKRVAPKSTPHLEGEVFTYER